jgi:hypothetical protein
MLLTLLYMYQSISKTDVRHWLLPSPAMMPVQSPAKQLTPPGCCPRMRL